MAIDTEAFKDQLYESWEHQQRSGQDAITSIPLFEDAVADFVISDWMEVSNGFEGVVGYIDDAGPGASTAWIHFDPYGGVKTVIRQQGRSFLIERLSEDSIYVIQALDALPEGTSFE